jgi:hypothetical protein
MYHEPQAPCANHLLVRIQPISRSRIDMTRLTAVLTSGGSHTSEQTIRVTARSQVQTLLSPDLTCWSWAPASSPGIGGTHGGDCSATASGQSHLFPRPHACWAGWNFLKRVGWTLNRTGKPNGGLQLQSSNAAGLKLLGFAPITIRSFFP